MNHSSSYKQLAKNNNHQPNRGEFPYYLSHNNYLDNKSYFVQPHYELKAF